jgi:hypothetical protein
MPRAGGVYTLPAGNPVVTLTTISSAWANTTMSDIATALTGSLPTDGSAPMSAALRLADGIVGAPGLTWASETTSGWYRIGLNQFGFSVAGVAALTVNANRGWTIPTPVAGTALTVNSAAAGFAIVTAGTKNILQAPGGTTTLAIQQDNGIQAGGAMNLFTTGGQFALGTADAQSLLIATNAVVRITLNSAGNVTIAAPTSGTALAVTGVASGTAFRVTDASTFGIQIQHSAAGTGPFINADAANTLRLGVGGTEMVTIASAGNVTINAPSSGTTLVASGNAIQFASKTTVARGGGNNWIDFQDPTGESGFIGYGASTNNFYVQNNLNGTILLGTNNVAGMVTIASSGAVTIAAPTSGSTACTINGIASSSTLILQAPNTASSSFGLVCASGTNSSDSCAIFENAAANTVFLKIFGDGGVTVGNAPTGGDEGAGTINVATGYFVNGVPLSYTYTYKAATTTRTNNAVQSADPDLTFNCVSGHKYAFKMFLAINGGAGGLTANLGGTAVGATAIAVGYGKINSAAFPGTPGAALNNSLVNVAAVGGNDYLIVDASFTCTSSGTVFLNWSQNNSNAAGTAIIASSYGVMTQLS